MAVLKSPKNNKNKNSWMKVTTKRLITQGVSKPKIYLNKQFFFKYSSTWRRSTNRSNSIFFDKKVLKDLYIMT